VGLPRGPIALSPEALLQITNASATALPHGETDAFFRYTLRQHHLDSIFSVTVSESGASIYSASDVARQEFGLTVRGAISIARGLLNPLSELLKVDPKSIGVGR
jgi:uncharacterized protein